VAALAALGAGCVDFVEPELPGRDVPAVARITVALSDSGSLTVNGTVAPGFDDEGLRRALLDATIAAAGYVVAPDDTLESGDFAYASTIAVDTALSAPTIEIRGPTVAGMGGAPVVRWPTVWRADGDTVTLEADGSLRLHVGGADAEAVPDADIRQWFLTLAGDSTTFRLGSDGPPPEELDIPARWVPANAESARLIYQQASTLRIGDDYVSLVTLDLRMHWTLRGGAEAR
jgi:hypothetical protein